MLALILRSIGGVGNMTGETIEPVRPSPLEAPQAAAARKMAQTWYGYRPQLQPSSQSIGLVLDRALNLFQWSPSLRPLS